MTIDIEERVRRAEDYFVAGFNCAQSVVAAYADIYGFTHEQALRLSAGFGGGIGRLRLTCGAALGMVALCGMESGSATPGDREGKSRNYADVQELLARFRDQFGTMTCAELLRLKKDAPTSWQASERTPEYYKGRPCLMQVGAAARIYGQWLEARTRESSPQKENQ